MKSIKTIVFPVLAAAIWISISEVVRNEFLVKTHWIEHYDKMDLVFPAEAINGAIWGLWALLFAIAIYIISNKFSLLQTFFLSWFVGFVLMWVVIGNLGVLPYATLYFAIPLSLLEAFVATYIIVKLKNL